MSAIPKTAPTTALFIPFIGRCIVGGFFYLCGEMGDREWVGGRALHILYTFEYVLYILHDICAIVCYRGCSVVPGVGPMVVRGVVRFLRTMVQERELAIVRVTAHSPHYMERTESERLEIEWFPKS